MRLIKIITHYKWSLLWGAFSYVLGLLPKIPKPKGVKVDLPFDKIAHVGLFGVLTFLIVVESGGLKREMSFWRWFMCWFVGAFATGGMLEVLQWAFFSPRKAEMADFIADLVGGLLSLVAVFIMRYVNKQR